MTETDDSTTAAIMEGFFKPLHEDLAKGELRMNLLPGTFLSLLDNPDQLMLVKIFAALEPLVNELIELGLSKPNGGLGGQRNSELFADMIKFVQENLSFTGRASKLNCARALGTLTKEDVEFIEALGKLRHRYAHHIKNASKPIASILREEMVRDNQIAYKLFFGKVKITGSEENEGLKLLIVWAFSQFLNGVERRHSRSTDGLLDLFGAGFMSKEDIGKARI